jgi:hypothetical protein
MILSEVKMTLKGSILVLPTYLVVLFVIALSAPTTAINASPATSIRWVKPDPNHPPHIDCKNIRIELEVEVLGADVPVQYVRFSRWDTIQQEYVVIGVDDAPPYQSEMDSQSLDPGWSQLLAEAFDETGDRLAGSWIFIYKSRCTYFLPFVENYLSSMPVPHATPLPTATAIPTGNPNQTPTNAPTPTHLPHPTVNPTKNPNPTTSQTPAPYPSFTPTLSPTPTRKPHKGQIG